MKSVELDLNKRLLIVDSGNFDDTQLDEKHKITLFHNGNVLKFICKGPDLTEDISKELVDLHETGYYKDYLNDNNFFTLPSKSFISAIQSKNYHWGENPVEKPTQEKYGWYSSCSHEEESDWMYEGGEEKYYEALEKYELAESRTFNPEKCLIFEIL